MNNGKDKTIKINEDRIIKRDKKMEITLIEIKQNKDDIDCHTLCLTIYSQNSQPKLVYQLFDFISYFFFIFFKKEYFPHSKFI